MRRISPKGIAEAAKLRDAGELQMSDEARRHMSEGQRKRFQRPEEQKKLEKARELSYNVIDFDERVSVMHEAFLAKYGSFGELAKMGLRAPKRKPNKLEQRVAKILGDGWRYYGQGDLVIGGLIPDFVRKDRKEVLEVLGCYFHACPLHFPDVKLARTASVAHRREVYERNGYDVIFVWEHEVKWLRQILTLGDPSVYAA